MDYWTPASALVVGAGTGFLATVLSATVAARWFTARRGHRNATVPAPASDPTYKGQPWNFLALLFCLMVGTAGLPLRLRRPPEVPVLRLTAAAPTAPAR